MAGGWSTGSPLWPALRREFESGGTEFAALSAEGKALHRYELFAGRGLEILRMQLARLADAGLEGARAGADALTPFLGEAEIDAATAQRRIRALLALARDLQAANGLVGAVGIDLEQGVRQRFSPEWLPDHPDAERDRLRDAISAEVAVWMQPGHPVAIREVAASLAPIDGPLRESGAPLRTTIELMLERNVSKLGVGTFMASARNWLMPSATSPPPDDPLVEEILEAIALLEPDAETVELEQSAWEALLAWYPEKFGAVATRAGVEALRRRCEELLDRTRGADDALLEHVVELVWLALDGHFVTGQIAAAQRWLTQVCDGGWVATLARSASRRELAAVRTSLDVPWVAGRRQFPPPPLFLLRELITQDCHRAAIYLVLAHHWEGRDASLDEWLVEDEVGGLDLAFRAAIGIHNVPLARSLYPSLADALGRSGSVPASRLGDVARINDLAREARALRAAQAAGTVTSPTGPGSRRRREGSRR